MDDTEIIRQFYDGDVLAEWNRLERFPIEFAVTKHFIDQHVQPGASVLDIGGGPGRYSLYLAEKGCHVTLLDLSVENVRFAQSKAQEAGVALTALHGDARIADTLVQGTFDCVLLMGPLYHLLKEEERIQAVDAAVKLLKPGGVLFASFISVTAGMTYYMDSDPGYVLYPGEEEYVRCFVEDRTYNGQAFTRACFIAMKEILPLMGRFPLTKLHFFGPEGITSPAQAKIVASDKSVLDRWIEIVKQTCEREELLSHSAHLVYVGRKHNQ